MNSFSIIQFKWSLLACCLIFLLYGSFLPVYANTDLNIFTKEEQAWIKENQTVVYGAENDWAPFYFVNRQGQHAGITRDYLDLISEKSTLTFKPLIENWNSILEKAQNNDIDLLVALYSSKERERLLAFTSSYQTMIDYFFVRDDFEGSSLNDLNGNTLAIPKGYIQIEFIKQKFPEIKILETNNVFEAVQAVLEEKADAVLDSYAVINYLLRKQAITSIRPYKALTSKSTNTLHMATSTENIILRNIINKSLAAISDQEKRKVNDKWFAVTPVRDFQTINLTNEEKSWLDAHKKIRFTGDPNWLPYEAFDSQGNYVGIVSQYLDLITERLEIEIEVIPSETWQQATQKILNNEVDIISETIDTELNSALTFTQSYLASPVVIVMNENENYVENIEQIRNKNIALTRDYGYVSEIIKKYPDIEFFYVDTVQEGLLAVSTGKMDAFLATLAQVSYLTSELGLNNVRIVGKSEFNTQLAFGMRDEFAPLVPMFNRALDDISQLEKLDILNDWGKQSYVEKTNYLLLLQIAGVLVAIILVIVYWNRRLANEIRERKRAETQTQTLIDNIPLQIVVTLGDGSIIAANPRALVDYDITKEEMQTHNIASFYVDMADHDSVIDEIRKHGQLTQKIIPFKRPNGDIHSMMISVMPIRYNSRNAFLTIGVDMTKRLQTENKLNEAKEYAESASRAKSEFLSNMSHEIRTPLNAIIGFTELLRDEIEQPKQKSFIDIIHSAGSNLLTLINDILDLSKIEAGKFTLEKSSCNLHNLFVEIGNMFMIKAQEQNVDLILEIDPHIPNNLCLDATRIRQVLFNLIGNAVKFTDRGHILIKVYTANQDDIHNKLDLVMEIEDSGIGISEDQQKIIFQDFEQSTGQDFNKYGGTGLGLSICKNLVTMMGGEISLRSEVGKGSTFVVKLFDVDVLSLMYEANGEAEKINEQAAFLPCKILIADDVKNNRDLLIAYFANTNIQVVEAENGAQAVELAKQDFDLILMDIRMPVMNGYQAAKEIKMFSNVPIVALTASVMNSEFERLKENNFSAYLRKPIHKSSLFEALMNHLPFEQVKNKKIIELDFVNEENLKDIPQVVEALEPLFTQYEKCRKNNDISEIRLFSEALSQVMQNHRLSVVSDFAKELNNNIDRFDIAAIEKSLNQYPILIESLKNRI